MDCFRVARHAPATYENSLQRVRKPLNEWLGDLATVDSDKASLGFHPEWKTASLFVFTLNSLA